MEEKLDNVEGKLARDANGRLLPNQKSLNPLGRPKGKTLKEYQAERFRLMSDEEKRQWMKDNNITGIDAWKMAEGNPATNTDITSGGLPIVQLTSEITQKNEINTSSESDSEGPAQI